MFERLLIANRGEIARRIMRTARWMGIETIAVHSEADSGMPFVGEADRAVCIGPAPAAESYLRHDRILKAAKDAGAQAIHPGYGFLSENAEFAEAVEAAGLVWVGANPFAIRAMGLKHAAKQRMMEAGVPVTPGYLGEDQSAGRLRGEAALIGYPVLIKAVAGGGGKGMRRVDADTDFHSALESCRREAGSAFGDDRVLIEKFILSPRHIEVQVFGDRHGSIVHLFERDCSLQRRHQKVIEEAPAPGMDAVTRAAICSAAVKAARAVAYVGAGTVEFIADASERLSADRIWFMEMNTRLQVEHPVTEAITGQDLVEWQLRIAAGEALPLRQEDIAISGSAVEARLYAENPAAGFLPSTGRLAHLRLPDGLRIDSGVEEGDEITPFYDPMIAKLISHGRRREDAARALAQGVALIEAWPVHTNAAFLARALNHPDFISGKVDTGFIERHAAELIPPAEPGPGALQAAARALAESRSPDPWAALLGFRMNAPPLAQVSLDVGGKSHHVRLGDVEPEGRADGGVVFAGGNAWCFAPLRAGHAGGGMGGTDGAIMAPMPGTVIAVYVTEGLRVAAGAALMTIEAMKMEQTLRAPLAGIVTSLKVKAGSQVTEGVLLARIAEQTE